MSGAPELLIDALEALEELQRRKDSGSIIDWEPYPTQLEACQAHTLYTVLFGGNQCLAGEQEVFDPVLGAMRRVDEIEGDFHVEAWTGREVVTAKAKKPYRKGQEAIYRVTFEDGTVINCSAGHLLLGPTGWVSCGQLFEQENRHSCVSVPRALSSSGHRSVPSVELPPIHPEDAARWMYRALGYLCDCPVCRRSHDARPPLDPASGQGGSPSQADALEHRSEARFLASVPSDDSGNTPVGSRACRWSHHLPTQDGLPLISALFVDSESHVSRTVSLPFEELIQSALRPAHGSNHPLQSTRESSRSAMSAQASQPEALGSRISEHTASGNEPRSGAVGLSGDTSFDLRKSTSGLAEPAQDSNGLSASLSTAILAYYLPNQSVARVDYLRIDTIWDFEVETYANYFIGSVLNHNSGKSTTGLYRMAWDLTGIYPEWYKGPRTEKAIHAWIVGETNESTRDSLQAKLFGPDAQKPGKGGIIPADKIAGKPSLRHTINAAFDTVRVRHISGGISYLTFKSYAQGRESLQSATLDRVLVDEEPPFDCFTELQMRLAAKQREGSGFMLITFTPLKGKTKVVDMFTGSDDPDVSVFFLSAEEATHLGREHVERYKRLYANDPEMLKARLYGLPDINSGLIWRFDWPQFFIPAFEIDPKWPRLGGLDFGWTHPTAFLVAAVDPITDTMFVYAEHLKAKLQYWEHTAAMRPFVEAGIQFAGDPSAEQPDKSSGKALIDIYHDDLMPGWFNVPPEERPIRKAPRTPQVRIEQVARRLETGRLYFFDHLVETKKQVQSYAYDKKGRLPELDDDLCDSLGYMTQCIQWARTPSAFRRPWQRKVEPYKPSLRGY